MGANTFCPGARSNAPPSASAAEGSAANNEHTTSRRASMRHLGETSPTIQRSRAAERSNREKRGELEEPRANRRAGLDGLGHRRLLDDVGDARPLLFGERRAERHVALDLVAAVVR